MATTVESRSMRGAELLGLVAFALALMLLIALATFDPRDPAPFFKAGVEGPARNFIGPFGAFLAEMLIPQLFGLASLLLPIVLGLLGWKLFWCKPIDAPYTKAFGNGVLLLSLAGLLSLAVGQVSFEGEPVRAGGAVGELVSGLLVADFSRTGAYILAATALFVALILSTQFSFSTFLHGTGGRIGERLRTLQTAWAHYRESRRKERMRRDVIRKHTGGKDEGGGLPRIRRVKTNGEAAEAEAAGRGPRRPAPARSAAAGGDAGAEGAALRGSGRRAGRGRARGPATQGGGSPPKGRPRRVGRRRRGPGELHPPPDHDPRRGQGRGPRGQRPAAREGPHPPVEVQRVRGDGHGEGDPPRPGGDHVRVQARRRRQVLEDRRPRGRPRPRPRGRVDPRRPHQREGQRRHRDPERGPRDDLPAGDPRVGHLPPLLGPTDPRARQGGERRRVDHRPRGDAPPADRRLHRHRQERGPQLHDREHPLPLDAGRGEAHPDRPQAARARGLRGHPAPAHPGGDRPQDRVERAQVGGRRDGAAHPDAGLGGRPQHRAVQQHHPGGEGRAQRRQRRGAEAPPLRRDRDRRARRPHDDLLPRGRGVDHPPRADGARGRDPPHPRHPAPLGGRHHRPHQGQLPLPHLVPRRRPRRQPDHPRLDRGRAAARPRGHALPAPGQRAAHPHPRGLRDRARDRAAHLVPAQAGAALLRRAPWASPRRRRRRRR